MLEMLEIAKVAALVILLATTIEALVEYLLGKPFDFFPKLTPWKWLLQYASAGIGIAICLYYKVDLIAALSQGLLVTSTVGMILTGALSGRGAEFLHRFISKFFPTPAITVEKKSE